MEETVFSERELLIEDVLTIFRGLPKTRQPAYVGELNRVLLFIERNA